jgi:hypothetical protein
MSEHPDPRARNLAHVVAVAIQGAAYGNAAREKAARVVPAVLRFIAEDMDKQDLMSADLRLYADELREVAASAERRRSRG